MSGSDATTLAHSTVATSAAIAAAKIPPHLRGTKIPPRDALRAAALAVIASRALAGAGAGGRAGPVGPIPEPLKPIIIPPKLVPVPPSKPRVILGPAGGCVHPKEKPAAAEMIFSDGESYISDTTTTTSSTAITSTCTVGVDILHYFTPVKKLGEGSFGKVYSARITSHGYDLLARKFPKSEIPPILAIKEIDITKTKAISTEIYFLSKLRLKGCIKYYGCIEIPGKKVYLIMEYYRGTDLFELILDDELDTASKSKIALNIAEAIADLHLHGVAHRDIKPENVMVNPATLEIKLIDYGLSCDVVTSTGICTAAAGTPGYYDHRFTPSSLDLADWWSFGQLLVVLYIGKMLYDKKKYHKLTLSELRQFPLALQPIIVGLTNPELEPRARPASKAILEALRK